MQVIRFSAAGYKRQAVAWSAGDDTPALLLFPGSFQRIADMRRQVEPEWLAQAGVSVYILGSRRQTGHTWLPAVGGMRDQSDLEAASELVRLLPAGHRRRLIVGGHSGGACFAHIFAWHYSSRLSEGDPAICGAVFNAGGLWKWAVPMIQESPARYPTLHRVGAIDRLVPAKLIEKACSTYADAKYPAEFRMVPESGHEWLRRDDRHLIEWVRAVIPAPTGELV